MRKAIPVTKPHLPPSEHYISYLNDIWQRGVLTNNGPIHQQLEQKLCEYLDVEHICLFNNGTVALIVALQALDLKNEVITTPYSFVATAHSLLWRNLTPVFVDIDPATMSLDVSRVADSISERTTAIMPVHCYGMPCAVEQMQDLADKHSLSLIYDAAHAFGVKYNGQSLLRHGDLAVLSFHATKVFHTFEGGAIVCRSPKMKERIDSLKNFGFKDEVTVAIAGMNGKLNEMSAAMGLLQLKEMDFILESRRAIDEYYRMELAAIKGIRMLEWPDSVERNYGYFPIFISDSYKLSRDELYQKMKDEHIFARRYFYPLISDFPMYRHLPSAEPANLPIAAEIARQVLCLPIYPALEMDDVRRIVDLIRN